MGEGTQVDEGREVFVDQSGLIPSSQIDLELKESEIHQFIMTNLEETKKEKAVDDIPNHNCEKGPQTSIPRPISRRDAKTASKLQDSNHRAE